MASDYELNEKDIDTALAWLKINDPENATPEKAITMIEEAMASAHMLGHHDPTQLEQLFRKTEKGQTYFRRW